MIQKYVCDTTLLQFFLQTTSDPNRKYNPS